MKKYISIVLIIVVTLSLFAGCTKTEKQDGIVHNGKIPEGGLYVAGFVEFISNDDGITSYEITYENVRLEAGDKFPEKHPGGLEYYFYGDYAYQKDSDSWTVMLLDKNKEKYGEVIAIINNLPVTDISYTFANCTKLKEMPVLPSTITNMYRAFSGCESLTKIEALPKNVERLTYTFCSCTNLVEVCEIPEKVSDMEGTFSECFALKKVPNVPASVESLYSTFAFTQLEGELQVDANVSSYENCFFGMESHLTITGKCSEETKINLVNTSEGNVTYK